MMRARKKLRVVRAHSHQDALNHIHTHDALVTLLAQLQIEGNTAGGPETSEKAGANGAANGAGLESHSLGQDAYSDDDDDAHEEVRLASALLPCKTPTTDDDCNGLEYIARVR